MDPKKKGFDTSTKHNYFKINSAWSLHPVGNPRPDPYEDGVFAIGHRFRPK
jgi:hypothetical protein